MSTYPAPVTHTGCRVCGRTDLGCTELAPGEYTCEGAALCRDDWSIVRRDGQMIHTPRDGAFAKPTTIRIAPQSTELDAGHAFTDYGNAEALVARHGADLRYSPKLGWLCWSGKHWAPDETGEVHRRARDTIRAMFHDAAKCGDDGKSELRDKIIKHARSSERLPRLSAMVTIAQSELPVAIDPEAFDTNPWQLTVSNGSVNLKTGELTPHNRDDMSTKLAPVVFNPQATCPRWLAFLDRMFASDKAVIEFIQRVAGYATTGVTTERAMFVLHGCGANGKSVFLATLGNLLGTYANQTPTSTLMQRRDPGIPSDIAALAGSRFVTASEVNENERFDIALVKRLTGGADVIKARFLHREWFAFRPTFKMFLACNHKPDVRDSTDSAWDRIRLVACNVRIPESERDPDLEAKLKGELSGVLSWALAGALAWQRDGLQTPASVKASTAAYRGEQDILSDWLGDCCEIASGTHEQLSALYESYTKWCPDAGIRQPMTRNKFGRRLKERGFEPEHSGGRQYSGLQLNITYHGFDA